MKKRFIVPVENQIKGMDVIGLPSDEDVKRGFIAEVIRGEPMHSGNLMIDGLFWNRAEWLQEGTEEYKWYEGLKDRIVVDLGAGRGVGGYELSRIIGAKGYVGVEPFFARDLLLELEKYLEETPRNFKEKEHIPVSVVCDDMLRSLKRMPSNSVSLLCGAVDECVLGFDNLDYNRDVSKEIERVLHPRGSYIGDGSIFIPSNLRYKEGMESDTEKYFK